MTTENIDKVAANLAQQLQDLPNHMPTNAEMEEISIRLRILADALDEERDGRKDFTGGKRPLMVLVNYLGK